jgi:hypothetical protein
MPPKHRQLRAPRPKAPGSAFQALVDPPNDGNNLSIDGEDGKDDATDDNSAVNACQCVSTTAASPEQLLDNAAQLVQITNLYTTVATSTRDYVQKTSDDMHNLLIEMDDRANARLEPFYNILKGPLQRMDTVLNDNTELRAAYDASKAETAALKAAVDTLTWKFDEQIATPAPPSPDLTASSIRFICFLFVFICLFPLLCFFGSFSTVIYDSRDGGKRAAGSSGSNVGYTLEKKKKKKKREKWSGTGKGGGKGGARRGGL